jgi:hypothetical protein
MIAMRRFRKLLAVLALAAVPVPAMAQARLSLGAGGGLAGSTESSLSDGRGAPAFMLSVTKSVLPLVGIGVEVNDWRHSGSNIAFATGNIQLHLPVLPLFVKVGAGVGTGDPDGKGRVTGTAVQIGGGYDLTLPLAPVALTIFSNALLAYTSARSVQMVDAGLALTWK